MRLARRPTELQQGWQQQTAWRQVAQPPGQPLVQQRQHAAVPEDGVPRSTDVGAKRSMPHLRLSVTQKIVDRRSLATEILNVLAAGMKKERVTFHAHTSKFELEVEPVQFAEVEIFKLLDDRVKSRKRAGMASQNKV
jgi:hypothetical protein